MKKTVQKEMEWKMSFKTMTIFKITMAVFHLNPLVIYEL